MNGSADNILMVAVVSAGLLSAMRALLRRNKSNAEVLFAIFCGSVAMSMLRPSLEGQPGWLLWAVTLGGCATCNIYWLLSRSLFRGEGGVQPVHVAVALTIALLIMASRMTQAMSPDIHVGWTAVFSSLLDLASSTVLVLAFVEALRGWSSALPLVEKRLRLAFMLVFGSCLLAATITGAIMENSPEQSGFRSAIVYACALLIIIFTHYALHIRKHHPLRHAMAHSNCNTKSPVSDAKPEDLILADSIRHQLEVLHVFRDPELKVADLAGQLNMAEYKASRLITQVLGERNFNQMVNRYRIAHARQLLEVAHSKQSILDISCECGFASLGPFNRAFKTAMGTTPSAYRANFHREMADKMSNEIPAI